MIFHLSSHQTVLQDIENNELTKQEREPDVKYQDIIYHMDNKDKTVCSKDHIHIDFLKAMSEMKKLDWKYENNYIAFDNKRTNEYVQFIRLEQNKWYADIPIKDGKDWDGYTWSCYSNSKTILGMMRLFFEELPWFGMLSWKMRRFKH